MEQNAKFITVYLCTDKVLQIDITASPTAEDACVEICKQIGVGPVARYLFALKLRDTKFFCPDYRTLCENEQYEFRIRFKVPSLSRLRKVDIKAYDYYFNQARQDVMNNKIPDISYDKYKWELVGLGVADMYRVMLETGVDRDNVESDYKKYIPKEVVKHHMFFIKRPIHESLCQISNGSSKHDAWYVKGEYLKQFEEMAPNYLTEEYKALMDEGGSIVAVWMKINPFHKEMPGISFRYDGKKQWSHLCAIDDLCFISVRSDRTIEISRKTGIPSYLKFQSTPMLLSFVSLLDGYYRLMVKWTFNLCKDVPTPSLKRLYMLKCHGPVGGEFSYAKLQEKRNNKAGCFILRESETKYNVYYLDVCTTESLKPKTYKIEKLGNERYYFSKDEKEYKSIPQLVAAYRSTSEGLCLLECIPPSEYDKSQLLLCKLDYMTVEDLSGVNLEEELKSSPPQCIDVKTLQVYKNQKKEGRSGICIVYRTIWKVSKGKKIEVAMKILKQESRDKYIKSFMELAGQWAFLHSNAIVRLYGVTMSSPLAMVMEYLPAGPLDAYLREHKADMKQVDLVEAGSYLATALWYLEERGVAHGNIRCWKLLVHTHNENTFLVKLADPGLFEYSSSDIHWIAPEYFTNVEMARSSVPADVWAFSTTLWQIFAYGEHPPESSNVDMIKKLYSSGKILPKPQLCPDAIYNLMSDCWDLDPYRRKKPQAIMRDINQILYEVFNSRRAHSYASPFPKLFKPFTKDYSTSKLSISSMGTEMTDLDYPRVNGTLDGDNVSIGGLSTRYSGGSSLEGAWLLDRESKDQYSEEELLTPDISSILTNFNFQQDNASVDSVTTMQAIFELDEDYNVVLQGRIGQGFYGEVYKGSMERGGDIEPQLVAIKKLKTSALATSMQDFEREIAIMKTVKHPNIVEIKGVIEEPEISLVMEYVQHGSLQSYLKIHKESLEDGNLLKFALDVAKGMDYLGTKNIVHRDLAARNILVANEHHVKISDFGLAQFIGNSGYYKMKTSRDLPIKWYAPESLRDGKFSPQSDVWSYGVTLYEMFSRGEDPILPACINHQDQQALLTALENGARLPCPCSCPQELYIKLMCPCWQAEPYHRPKFSELVKCIEDLMIHYELQPAF
ncbi:tyrosine-protein kinase hopscotch [Schistocerca americana]|uniref:tyrosine-protein kinase hopscotch n=1 Tax=Schistocerca americana TaxID=7009 RepID=UPI001F4FBC1B|nr:tyrosine-protein kinase hopscotch [Schistocerca americana]XP_047114417.1 tyrosine-protein kinase hopscotch [Schistocerca piceifrons]XP_049962044.1 tyrosine-protein kinase hopscotch [Schistocerca serialis cubense]